MNSCGECTVCCTVFGIKQMNKPSHVDCSKLKDKSCSIYPDRPSSCKKFECGFISNNWRKELRPDLCGVMILAFPSGVEAWQLTDSIGIEIYDKMVFMRTKQNVNIKEIDARGV